MWMLYESLAFKLSRVNVWNIKLFVVVGFPFFRHVQSKIENTACKWWKLTQMKENRVNWGGFGFLHNFQLPAYLSDWYLAGYFECVLFNVQDLSSKYSIHFAYEICNQYLNSRDAVWQPRTIPSSMPWSFVFSLCHRMVFILITLLEYQWLATTYIRIMRIHKYTKHDFKWAPDYA